MTTLEKADKFVIEKGPMKIELNGNLLKHYMAEFADLLIAERDAEIERMAYALRNCRLMAAREFHRTESDTWGHILRFCKDAGFEGGILRDEPKI